jgi:hypothetical protein
LFSTATPTSRDPAAETKAGCQRTPETKGGRSNPAEPDIDEKNPDEKKREMAELRKRSEMRIKRK